MPTPQRLASVLLVAIVSCVAVACGREFPGVQASVVPSPERAAAPVVIVETRGGECPEGACGSTIAIEADGRVHATAPARVELGTLTDVTVEAIATEIAQADFDAIRSLPFTDTCPTAYDGQETVYTFTTGSGPLRIGSCEFVVDPANPLFRAVAAALATVER